MTKKPVPTFTNAPLEKLPPAIVALKMRLGELDAEHARSSSPSRRRALEAKMALVRKEIAVEEEVDREAERWDWPLKTRLELELRKAERLYPEVAKAAEAYDRTVARILKGPTPPKPGTR